MKTSLQFNLFAGLLSLILLDLAARYPSQEAGAEPAAPALALRPAPARPALLLPAADTGRALPAHQPRLRVAAAVRRPQQ